jgi:hypothetical protein
MALAMSPIPQVIARKPYPSDLTDAQWELVLLHQGGE